MDDSDGPVELPRLRERGISPSSPSELVGSPPSAEGLSKLRTELLRCERSLRLSRRETLHSRGACAALERLREEKSARTAASQPAGNPRHARPGFNLLKENALSPATLDSPSPPTTEPPVVTAERSVPARPQPPRRKSRGATALAAHALWAEPRELREFRLEREAHSRRGRYVRRAHYPALLRWLGEDCVEVAKTHLTLRIARL